MNAIKWTRNVTIGQSGLASTDGRFQIVRVEEYILGTRCISFRLYVDNVKVATGKQGDMKAKALEIVAAEAEAADKTAERTDCTTCEATIEGAHCSGCGRLVPAETTNEPIVTTRKVEALTFQHEFGDTKPATRFEVLVDGALIGYVSSDSSESRAPSKGRTLGRLRGYSRRFLGHLDTNRAKYMPSMRNADVIQNNRKHAIEELVNAWQRATAN